MPLPALLSHALVAFTIEFDNEFEQQMPHRTTRGPAAGSRRGPWLVSMAMWTNFMRFIEPDGTPKRDVDALARITNLPGLQRWSYVELEEDPATEADGAVRRARTLHRDAMVRPTSGGLYAQRIWQQLSGVIEQRWNARFGADCVAELRASLRSVIDQLDVALPDYLPVVGVERTDPSTWLAAGRVQTGRFEPDLPALLSKVLLAFTIDFARDSRLSLQICANALRVLDEEGTRVRDLPLRSGVSREAVDVSLGFLARHGCVVIESDSSAARARVARLTPKGHAAQLKSRNLIEVTERQWVERFDGAERLRIAIEGLLSRRDALADGLRPYPDGWRAHPPYASLTEALMSDPVMTLPHYPMVLHRGGFPDGS